MLENSFFLLSFFFLSIYDKARANSQVVSITRGVTKDDMV
jgi:hypothetical protein